MDEDISAQQVLVNLPLTKMTILIMFPFFLLIPSSLMHSCSCYLLLILLQVHRHHFIQAIQNITPRITKEMQEFYTTFKNISGLASI